MLAASARASVVLPTPAGPTSVTHPGLDSACRTAASSSSRPIKAAVALAAGGVAAAGVASVRAAPVAAPAGSGATAHRGVQAEAVDVGAKVLLEVRVPGYALQAALALASASPSRGTGPPAGAVPCPRSAPCTVSTFWPARGPKAMR
jgi:hypothetical protein